MLTKEQFVKSVMHEMNIIRHLGRKVTPEMMEYRPSPHQRSTAELMTYLGHIFKNGVTMYVAGDSSGYKALFESATPATLENFDAIIEREMEDVNLMIMGLTDEDLTRESMVFGATATLAEHLLSVIKWAAAYKTQLFLYIKANGNHSIGTINLWAGRDMPPEA